MRSSFGVLGSWTTIFHEDDDPIGAAGPIFDRINGRANSNFGAAGPFWLCKRTSITPIEF